MTASSNADNDMHRVQFAHEAVHERLINWARWCGGGRGSVGSSPMFRHYRAPRYQNATDYVHIPVDGLDAADLEKIVGQLPEKHRDALRYFYVYSHAGMSVWQAVRALAVQRDTLVRLIHDARSMVKNRLATRNPSDTLRAITVNPASAVPASRREAVATVEQTERPMAVAA